MSSWPFEYSPRIQIHSSIAARDEFGTAISRDGTLIAYDRSGRGPVVVVIDGTFGSRTFGPNVKLPAKPSAHHTVVHYDRRGCGASGDTRPYAVAREVEDLEAVIDAAGGRGCVYGISSGAVLAVDAARRLPDKITKLALYEPPCVVDDSRAPWPADYADRVTQLVASGRRDEAVKLWMRQVGRRGDAVAHWMTTILGMPEPAVAGMRDAPPRLRPGHPVLPPAAVSAAAVDGKTSSPLARVASTIRAW
jgi:pimeloyl-ACP methyl ester carboxylesterase